MLRKKIFKKIGLLISCLLVVEIINIFPNEKEVVSINVNHDKGVIYLLDENNYIARLDYVYQNEKNDKVIKEMIETLTVNKNKENKLRSGFKALIPENTKLLNMKIDDSTVTLNFSHELINISEDLEEKMVEAIIYTITSIEEIDNIIIKVENKELERLPHSKKELKYPLNRSFKINKEYNLKGLDNIKETTVFYLAKKDDFLYYIPVTKYENTNKEKIEIIIDELKSSSTYKTNLISYIKEDAKLINYEILDKSLLLNFNDSILNDINTRNIIEEVTYAINLSISENYQVQSVCYYVNDSIINNYFLPLG